MDLHKRAEAAVERPAELMRRERPLKQPFRVFGSHVDAPVTHGSAEVLVPIRAVERMTMFCEKARPRNAGEFVVVHVCKKVAVAHVLRGHFIHDAMFAFGRFSGDTIRAARTVRYARRNGSDKHLFIVFISG